MQYRYVHVKSLINTITRPDSLFNGSYTIDPYQNCAFNCAYCDSTLDPTIYIKSNAEEILKKKIKNLLKKRIIIGSVHDPYQPIEQKLGLTRKLLLILKKHNHPIHIITKSELITRDLDILKQMDDVLVTVSIISLDTMICKLFEQDAPSSIKRFNTMKTLANNNIKTGTAMIPIFPFITDEMIEQVIQQSINHQASYFLHDYLELKGDQKHQVIDIIKTHFPALIDHYNELYEQTIRPDEKYINAIDKKVMGLCHRYQISSSINP